MHNLTDRLARRHNPEGHISVRATLRVQFLRKVGTSELDIQNPAFCEN